MWCFPNGVKMRPTFAILLSLLFLVQFDPQRTAAATFNTNDWAFLDNGQIRIGAKKTSGACIGYLSLSGSTTC